MMRHNRSKDLQQSRRGVAALEAAVVTPMLLILVLGTIEMGTALRASTILQSAVREAGRLASMDWRYVVE
ncbi:MAG: pilus assembly protein, partial [Fuerstiella sp.]